jgi:2-haloalkanoic acid dehalogenase type II
MRTSEPTSIDGIEKYLGSARAAFQAIGIGAFAQPAMGTVKAIGFDAFTIFNPFSVDAVIEETFPGKGTQLANAWRTRIFEYCWQRTLNGIYVDFWQVLDDAPTFTFKAAKADLNPDVRATLMDAFLQLKPWPDSVEALQSMRKAGIRLAYVSNLTAKMLNTLSQNAGIAGYFEHVLSTDRVKAYKTDPRAYKMPEDALAAAQEHRLRGLWRMGRGRCQIVRPQHVLGQSRRCPDGRVGGQAGCHRHDTHRTRKVCRRIGPLRRRSEFDGRSYLRVVSLSNQGAIVRTAALGRIATGSWCAWRPSVCSRAAYKCVR